MKRIAVSVMILLLLLTACTNNNNSNEPQPTPAVTSIETDKPTQAEISSNQVEADKIVTNAEEALVVLEQGKVKLDELDSASIFSMHFENSYFNNLDQPEESFFNLYEYTLEGSIKRGPKLADITESINSVNGELVNGQVDSYDESSRFSMITRYYVDPAQGAYTEPLHSSYADEVFEDSLGYIGHFNVDPGFNTFKDVDDIVALFMSFPEQLVIYKDEYEDENVKIDNWVIDLNLSDEQFYEHLYLLKYNLFSGMTNFTLDEQEALYHIEQDDLRQHFLSLSFDSTYNIVGITIMHTLSAPEDYTEGNHDNYFSASHYISFSDHNSPYNYSIPEELILNASYSDYAEYIN